MTPELRLVAACCRWPLDEAGASRIRMLAEEVSDWPLTAALTRAHRVEGLVWSGLRPVEEMIPAAEVAQFKGFAEEVRIDGIRAIGEALRVCSAVQAAGIEFLVVKGLPLALMTYGTVTIKNSIDLDLLVRPEDVVRTAAILGQLGYETLRPPRPLDAREFASWSRVAKEAWMVSDRGQVDLHWDLLDQPELLAGADPWAAQRQVELLPGHSLPTLGDSLHLAYLAAHGAMSGWSRLKWLADFAAFIAARQPEQRQALCEEARRIGSSRCLDQGLILVERLFGRGLVPAPATRDSEPLADMAERLIESRRPNIVLEKSRSGATLISRMQWRLRPGARFKWLELARRLRDQEIRFRLRWPINAKNRAICWPLRAAGTLFAALHFLVRGPRSES